MKLHLLIPEDRKVFFSSDHHFYDDRFELMSRPFSSLEEMHEAIINNHNKVVGDDDFVFFLGDMLYKPGSSKDLEIINRLNGTKFLVMGNYDKLDIKDYEKYFKEVSDEYINLYLTYKDQMCNFHLNHYPKLAIDDKFNLVGHIHGAFKIQKNMINVGVDVNHFRPFSLEKILHHCNAIRSKYYDDNVFVSDLGEWKFVDPIIKDVI